MNRIEKQQQVSRLETLTQLALGTDEGFVRHVLSCQERAGTPVVIRVAHVGNSLVVHVYATTINANHAMNIVHLPVRQLARLYNPVEEVVHWFAVNEERKLYLIDAPTLTQLPLRPQTLLTCFHPLTPSELAVEDNVESYALAIEA